MIHTKTPAPCGNTLCKNPNCSCDPCTCTKAKCCDENASGTCCGVTSTDCKAWCKLDKWSWLRVLLAVGLIVGAYIAGVCTGFEKGDHREKYGREWEDRREGRMVPNYIKTSRPMDTSPTMHDMGSMNPMDMSMRMMGQMLAGKTGDALDKAFLEGMIPHHEGAVEMAKYLTGAKHPELVKLGQDIITAQTQEIEQMKKWMTEWGYTSTVSVSSTTTVNPQDEMMREHCKTMPEMVGCEKYR